MNNKCIPALLFTYCRPSLVNQQISLLSTRCQGSLFVIVDHPSDETNKKLVQLNLKCHEIATSYEISNPNIKVLRPQEHLGVDRCIPFFVNRLLDTHPGVFVIEDDCLLDLEFFLTVYSTVDYMQSYEFHFSAQSSTMKSTSSEIVRVIYARTWGWYVGRKVWKEIYSDDKGFKVLEDIDASIAKIQKAEITIGERRYWLKFYNKYINGKITYWDGLYTLSLLLTPSIRAYSKCSDMMENVGFDQVSSHSLSKLSINLSTKGRTHQKTLNKNSFHSHKLTIQSSFDRIKYYNKYLRPTLWRYLVHLLNSVRSFFFLI